MTHVLLLLPATALRSRMVGGDTPFPNMNGEHLLSKTPKAPAGRSFPTAFSEYPGGVEYFEVYHGPITTRYSQVWWTSTANDLPAEIVKRFDGKVMAIVGLEMDQVRKTPEGDVPVPITLAYNHHHDTAVVGKGARLVEMAREEAMSRAGRDYIRLSHGRAWVAEEQAASASGAPSSAMFSDGNGGEYRKSFHALAPPFVQLVDSPRTLAGSPMQARRPPKSAPPAHNSSGFAPYHTQLKRHSLPTSGSDRHMEPRQDESHRPDPVRPRPLPAQLARPNGRV